MVRRRHADGPNVEPLITGGVVLPQLATPPASLMLPALDHEQHAESAAWAAAVDTWPGIERLLDAGAVGPAVLELELLAVRMRELTLTDPPPWFDVLTSCRAICYDNITYAGTLVEVDRPVASAALRRCREWDTELAGHLDALLGALGSAADTTPEVRQSST